MCIPLIWWQAAILGLLWMVPLSWFLVSAPRRRLVIGVLALIACVLTSALAARYTADIAWWCSLIEPQELYAGPSERYHVVAHLDARASVHVIDAQENWMCVCTEKCRGWLPLTEKK